MFDYLDNTMTDLEFMSIFVILFFVAHAASWAFNRWVDGGRK